MDLSKVSIHLTDLNKWEGIKLASLGTFERSGKFNTPIRLVEGYDPKTNTLFLRNRAHGIHITMYIAPHRVTIRR